MSGQRYVVIWQHKTIESRRSEWEYDDKAEAERHFTRLSARFPGVIVTLEPIPRFRVEWRDRVTGHSGVYGAQENSTSAWEFAHRLDGLYPNKDHWVAPVAEHEA